MRLGALVAGVLHLASAAALAEAPAELRAENETSSKADTASPSNNGSGPKPTQLTLWDVGFSLRQSWLAEQEECPIPPPPEIAATAEESVGASREADAQDLPSFEEWRRSQEDEAPQPEREEPEPGNATAAPIIGIPDASPPPVRDDTKKSSHGRYDYASPDCSARIHSSSRQTQHASSLLHKSKDRYMLTPCKADEHWVVIELCDEIRIESFDLANWEFFSGVVRDIRVSVGGEDGEDWKEVGAFVANNIRGVQTFHLPQATAFHRFMRLDFASYYGSEYYCPISQVKVYGMNQMEAFKWEQKQLNLKAVDVKEQDDKEQARSAARAEERKREEARRERELGELERLVQAQARRLEGGLSAFLSSAPSQTASSVESEPSQSPSTANSTTGVSSPTQAAPTISEGNATAPANSTGRKSDSSEAIYAQIIRRLNAVEGNSTLVGRYIEEQSRVIRLLLGRMERGWDEWKHEWEEEERVRRGQEQMRQEGRLGRVLSQLEQQRLAIDQDRKMMENHLRILREELGHERRRGIAQLLIMVAVIVLGIMTRGSTIDAVLRPLFADVRRRRSFYSRRSLSGPVKPEPAQLPRAQTPESPDPDKVDRRPTSPGILRQRRAGVPAHRSVSEAFGLPLSPRLRPLGSPRPSATAPRRPGRNAHLHPLRLDDSLRKTKRSPGRDVGEIVPTPLPVEEDWGTDHENEASSSEVEDDLAQELASIWQTKPL